MDVILVRCALRFLNQVGPENALHFALAILLVFAFMAALMGLLHLADPDVF